MLALALATGCGRSNIPRPPDDPFGRGPAAPPPINPAGLDGASLPDVPPASDGPTAADAAADAAPAAVDVRPATDGGTAPGRDGPAPPAPDSRDGPGPPPDATPPPADRAAPLPPDGPTTPPLPAGCQVVSCDGVATDRTCCAAWYYFGLEAIERGGGQRDGLVTSFSKGADVRATFVFDGKGQTGAVGMLLGRVRRPTAVRVTSEWGGAAAEPPIVSAEATSGISGCSYPLLAGGQADLARPLYCWGDRGFVPDRVNVRVVSRGPGSGNVRVTRLDVR